MGDLTPVHLRDGTTAYVVPLLPANREALHEEFERLSAETRFDRFLTQVPELSETMLDQLVDDVDGVDHVALVLLVLTDDGTELPLGLARIIRYPDDPTAADVAVTVVDAWHGRGVATALLGVLLQHRPPGVERLVTVVSADNEASLAMLRRLGEAEIGPAGGRDAARRGRAPHTGGLTGVPLYSSRSLARPGSAPATACRSCRGCRASPGTAAWRRPGGRARRRPVHCRRVPARPRGGAGRGWPGSRRAGRARSRCAPACRPSPARDGHRGRGRSGCCRRPRRGTCPGAGRRAGPGPKSVPRSR